LPPMLLLVALLLTEHHQGSGNGLKATGGRRGHKNDYYIAGRGC